MTRGSTAPRATESNSLAIRLFGPRLRTTDWIFAPLALFRGQPAITLRQTGRGAVLHVARS